MKNQLADLSKIDRAVISNTVEEENNILITSRFNQ